MPRGPAQLELPGERGYNHGMRVLVLCLLILLSLGCDADPPPIATDSPASLFTETTEIAGLELRIPRPVTADDYYMPDSMGPGVGVLDFDGDGDLDILRISAVRSASGALESESGTDRLYRNDGNGTFTDATAAAGLGDRGYGMGVAVGDIDGDGDPDLYITHYGPDRLYRNDGGRFVDITSDSEPLGVGWSASAGFFDHDGDGDLDLFVTRYLDLEPYEEGSDAAGRPEYPAPAMFPGVPDLLYRNRGDGTFEDISLAAGISGKAGKGLGVLFTDLDGDGRGDIYVANDGEPNFAWIADGTGAYRDLAVRLGLAVNGFGKAEAGMGVDLGDVNGDGALDLALTHLISESHTLYLRDGEFGYRDGTSAAGLAAPTVPLTGFGVGLLDADLDGDLDLAAVHGRVLRSAVDKRCTLPPHWAPYAEGDRLFLGDGAGRFACAGPAAGSFGSRVEVSRGLAWGDLDGDGDLDLAVTTADGALRLHRSEAAGRAGSGSWLIVRPVDPRTGGIAIGAVVTLRTLGRAQTRTVSAARSYLSSVDPRAHFGLGAERGYDAIWVRWPDGVTETFAGGAAGRVIEVRKGDGE